MTVNEYLKNLCRLEFAVTLACTGRCIHCQNGDPVPFSKAARIDASAACAAVRRVCAVYPITSVMTFGGEPMLCPETVCAIHRTAAELGVGRRQVITNGFFSESSDRIGEVVRALAESGVNDLLLSVDAFHQETIPLGAVKLFAQSAAGAGIPIRLSPAWLVSQTDENPYNLRTRAILGEFLPLGIPLGSGNTVFPSGNALKYLRAYFGENTAEFSPYEEDPTDIRTLSFSPDGDVLNGNLYHTDILEIIRSYRP